LETYYAYQQDEKRQLFNQVLDLCMSCQRKCSVKWVVLDQNKSPRLGYEAQNARLGINSHLGQLAAV